MTKLADLLQERVMLLDGGMGTQILARKPTVDDFGGTALDGCMELLNERRPQWIREIHAAYLDAGADAVETNTFGANDVVLGEFGIPERTEELNLVAARLALDVARSYDRPRFVIGSAGPGTKLLTLGHIDYPSLFRSYRTQMRGLLLGGVDAILIETSQDLGQIKCAVRAARSAMADTGRACPIWVQATVETTGTLLLGTELQAVLTSVEMLGLDVLGLNCGTGPDEMHAPLQTLGELSPFRISCLPNAGLPVNQDGNLVYPLDPDAFADKVAHLARKFGVNIVGGCCGTTPAHIRALSARLGGAATPRTPAMERSAASLYQSVSLTQEPRPLIVGERTNANGSKKFRDLLAREDFDGLAEIARDQQREGAHMLDVCVAYVGRDEARDMTAFLRKTVPQTLLPIMIDTTEVAVLEVALQNAPGKCVVNSINFEDGEDRARKVLDLCRAYGAAVVGLTIDEQGMAHTVEGKLAVAQRLYDLVVGEYGFDPSDLIIDPLTFTLGSGDETFRGSAVATLEAIRAIKARLPGVLTILGVSNVSFGLSVPVRHVLNALMLYHGVKAGLDMAIFNAAKVIPVASIPAEQRQAAEDLLFDRRRPDYDPLKVTMALFAASGAAPVEDSGPVADLPVEERLRRDILGGEKRRILDDVDEALGSIPPLDLINRVLLDAMRVVGERFGAGEMQLPFVLESAEAMKAAVKRIEPHLPKESSTTKGRMVLATVKGDVHDIGKNLVEIILSNNGYQVLNLGIKQPVESILAALDGFPADAIGLSGLLVKSTTIMRENLAFMEERGLRIPVILGGAALTRDFVAEQCQAVYSGRVLYAEDAFEGLRHMDAIVAGTAAPEPAPAAPGASGITVLHRGGARTELTPAGQSSWVKRGLQSPEPPFWGVAEAGRTVAEIFEYLDSFVVIRNRWSFTQGQLDDAAFAAVLRDKAEPLLAAWKQRILQEDLLEPRALYGYFPVRAEGDSLAVYAPDRTRILARIPFPRQEEGRRLCIADFYAPDADRFDVLPVQLVTLGRKAADLAAQLYRSDQYSDYFLFHGLATELTEAYAELLHARIRRELGIHGKDAPELRQLFSQGYQGSRYSFGYPACPDLEGNATLLDLLGGERIGVGISEQFQMDPEYSTSALVAWHPQARYFAT